MAHFKRSRGFAFPFSQCHNNCSRCKDQAFTTLIMLVQPLLVEDTEEIECGGEGMCLWMGMAHNSRQADIKSVCAETCPRTVMDYLALIPLPARPGLAQPTDPDCLECDKIAGGCQGCREARFISLRADG
ncbi:hypothetical protein ROHU_017545 [Labeo rohita]|uniref:Uncharacterized protein n=1 Tax=Labeo rohita TaxID=84645 RepID=A0A498N884_LABRO|nr:hypothetical protein ROHU_017545 [Labeo rohita]